MIEIWNGIGEENWYILERRENGQEIDRIVLKIEASKKKGIYAFPSSLISRRLRQSGVLKSKNENEVRDELLNPYCLCDTDKGRYAQERHRTSEKSSIQDGNRLAKLRSEDFQWDLA